MKATDKVGGSLLCFLEKYDRYGIREQAPREGLINLSFKCAPCRTRAKATAIGSTESKEKDCQLGQTFPRRGPKISKGP